MVPGDTESFHSRSEISIFCQKLGPRRRMIHPAMFLPQKILLEIPRVLPNIVEQPALPGRFLHFRSRSKFLRQPGHLPEMVQQELRWPFPRWIQMGQIWFSIHHHLLQLHPLLLFLLLYHISWVKKLPDAHLPANDVPSVLFPLQKSCVPTVPFQDGMVRSSFCSSLPVPLFHGPIDIPFGSPVRHSLALVVEFFPGGQG